MPFSGYAQNSEQRAMLERKLRQAEVKENTQRWEQKAKSYRVKQQSGSKVYNKDKDFKQVLSRKSSFGYGIVRLSEEEGDEQPVEQRKIESGVDFLQQDENLNDKYQKGAYLLFDCIDKHWVCSGKIEYDRCKEHRVNALLDKDEKLPCAFFAKFSDRKSCHQAQLEVTERGALNRLCDHPMGYQD